MEFIEESTEYDCDNEDNYKYDGCKNTGTGTGTGKNINDELILKITQLTQEVHDIKNMFRDFIRISQNNSSSSSSSSASSTTSNNLSASRKTNDAECLVLPTFTDNVPQFPFTEFLTNIDINQDDLHYIFNIDSYEDGFIELLQKYITPEDLYYCPLRSFLDKRGKLFYVYDRNQIDYDKLSWNVISSTELASKLRIIQQKIMAQFCVWQNENAHSFKTHSSQENYRIQISKLTSGVVDKVIQSNSTFRNKLFELVKL